MSVRIFDTNVLVAVFLIFAVFGVRSYTRYRHILSITPPGPRPLPFFGNIAQVPTHEPWKAYLDWSKKHNSDVISVRAFGKLTIVINSAKAAQELLGKRAANYSNKPSLSILEPMGWSWAFPFMPYGEQWRTRRRLMHQAIHENVIAQRFPVQSHYAHRLLQDLFSEPQRFPQHILSYTSRAALMTAYGLEDERYKNIAQKSMRKLTDSIFLGTQLVNFFPLFIKLPEWFPGTNFHSYARESRGLTQKMRYGPIVEVQKRMADGKEQPSLAASMLNSAPELDMEAIVDVSGIFFVGAVDTTTSTITASIKALALYPGVQERAQAEMDLVIGRDRLPLHSDRSSLPYVEAVCRELHRWHTVIPLGVPGASMHDDIYDGYLIPGGTTYLWNAWAIAHDPEVYEDPDAFKPERWLDEDGQLTGAEENTGFGYGRRACVGIHYAKTSVWIAVASMLSAFRFSKAKDESGQDIEIVVGQTDSMTSYPVPFQCNIQPRDGKAVQLLKALDREELVL